MGAAFMRDFYFAPRSVVFLVLLSGILYVVAALVLLG
jgi:hypothetical protein